MSRNTTWVPSQETSLHQCKINITGLAFEHFFGSFGTLVGYVVGSCALVGRLPGFLKRLHPEKGPKLLNFLNPKPICLQLRVQGRAGAGPCPVDHR